MMYDRAIRRLVPNAEYAINGNDIVWEFDKITNNWISENFIWLLPSVPKPTKLQIEQSLEAVKLEWNSTEYQRLRRPEYPPLVDLADALYWQAQGDQSKMTAYLAAVDAVKSKYPKGVE